MSYKDPNVAKEISECERRLEIQRRTEKVERVKKAERDAILQ